MSCPIYFDNVTMDSPQGYGSQYSITATLKTFEPEHLNNLYYIDEDNSHKFDIQKFGFTPTEPEIIREKKSEIRAHKIIDLILVEITKEKLNNYEQAGQIANISLGSMDFADFIQQENLGVISALWDSTIDFKDYKISRDDKKMRSIILLK